VAPRGLVRAVDDCHLRQPDRLQITSAGRAQDRRRKWFLASAVPSLIAIGMR
jgi:hypothetical protein